MLTCLVGSHAWAIGSSLDRDGWMEGPFYDHDPAFALVCLEIPETPQILI